MVETTGEDGSEMQIIYRNGGEVRASCVEQLCDKVWYLCVGCVVSLQCGSAACPPHLPHFHAQAQRCAHLKRSAGRDGRSQRWRQPC